MKKYLLCVFPLMLAHGCQNTNSEGSETKASSVPDSVFIFYERHDLMKVVDHHKKELVDQSDHLNWLIVEEGEGENLDGVMSPSGHLLKVVSEPHVPTLGSLDTGTDIAISNKIKDWCSTRINSADNYETWPYSEQAKQLKKEFYEHCPITKIELEKCRAVKRIITQKRENWVIHNCPAGRYDATLIDFGMAHFRIAWILKHEGRNVKILLFPPEMLGTALASAVVDFLVFEDEEYFKT